MVCVVTKFCFPEEKSDQVTLLATMVTALLLPLIAVTITQALIIAVTESNPRSTEPRRSSDSNSFPFQRQRK